MSQSIIIDKSIIRILYIENETYIADLFRHSIEAQGYSVDLAYNESDGLALCKVNNYQIVAVNCLLPDLSCMDIVRKLLIESPNLSLLLITDRGCENIAVEALNFGISNYVVKDNENTHLELIPSIIENLLQRAKEKQQQIQLQLSLQKNKEQWKLLTENSPNHIILLDTNYKIQFINYTLPDLTIEQVIGKSIMDFVPVEDTQIAVDCFDRVRQSGNSDRYETRYIMTDGEIQYFDVLISPVKGEDGNITGFISSSNNITARKQDEITLRENEQRYQDLFSKACEGIIIMSPAGELVSVNESFAQMHGCSMDEILAINIHTLDAPSARHLVDERINRVLSGESITFEVEHYHKDGHIFPLEVSSSLIYSDDEPMIQAFHRDITQRKQTEIQLQESRQQYRDIVENTPDLITRADLKGRILFINHAANNIYGLEPAECIGRNAFDFIHPDDLTKSQQSYNLWISSGKMTTLHENRQVSIDGKVHHILWSVRREFNDNGKMSGFASTGKDITEHKRLEEQLQTHQHMDAIGTLVGGIAHDFNNILAALKGNIDLLNMAHENFNEKQKKFLGNATKSSVRAVELIGQLQTLSTVRSSKTTTVDIYDIAEEVFGLLEETTDRLIRKEVKFNKGEFFVSANAGELHQVLLNLATNSAHSLEEMEVTNNDYIRIKAEHYQVRSGDRTGLSEGDYVHISFKDSGGGMSNKVLKKAFEPLFTTKDKDTKRGQGLGLAMVYNIVTRHSHGFIEIASKEGKGTTFHIYLPKVQSEITIDSQKTVATKGGTETLLVVDDDEMVASMAEEMLMADGYTVLIANDGMEALEVYAQKMGVIAAVILDLNMPKMSGKQVFEEMLKINPEVRVIISSGYGVEQAQQGILAEAKGNLSKPYALDDLSRVVRNVLDS